MAPHGPDPFLCPYVRIDGAGAYEAFTHSRAGFEEVKQHLRQSGPRFMSTATGNSGRWVRVSSYRVEHIHNYMYDEAKAKIIDEEKEMRNRPSRETEGLGPIAASGPFEQITIGMDELGLA